MNSVRKFYGMHPYGHDSTVCYIDEESKTIFAVALERLTRVKHDSRFSGKILKHFDLPLENSHFFFPLRELNASRFRYFDLAHVYGSVIKEFQKKSGKRLTRLGKVFLSKPLQTMLASFFFMFSDSLRGVDNLDRFETKFKRLVGNKNVRLSFFDHHTSHAASAYYFAPKEFYDDCLVVTLDGQGDGKFSKVFIGTGGFIQEVASSSSTVSVNLLFSIFTKYLQFNANADEGKLEALASFSTCNKESNRVYKALSSAFKVKDNIEIVIERTESFPFDQIRGRDREIHDWIESNFGDMPKEDIASGMQLFYEDFICRYIFEANSHYRLKRLAVAGGGFANVKLNRRIFESGEFVEIYVHPSMGDDGASLGALILGLVENGEDVSWLRNIEMPFFGPEYSKDEVVRALNTTKHPVLFEEITNLSEQISADLIQGLICALFQGKMEFGPRSLGNRSILANPLSHTVKDDLNLKFKRREWFQPFCPSILLEERERLFQSSYINNHMTCAFTLRPNFIDVLPGVTHVDGTARAQFVTPNTNPNFYEILKAFKKLSGFGVLLNTSFNIHGKTIVLTPEDALDDFMSCNIDVLYMENFRITRK